MKAISGKLRTDLERLEKVAHLFGGAGGGNRSAITEAVEPFVGSSWTPGSLLWSVCRSVLDAEIELKTEVHGGGGGKPLSNSALDAYGYAAGQGGAYTEKVSYYGSVVTVTQHHTNGRSSSTNYDLSQIAVATERIKELEARVAELEAKR